MDRIASDEIYRGRVVTLRKDTIRTAEGKELKREVVAHPGAVVVLAEEGGDLLFVRQYRYAAGEELLELVAGTLEPGEEPAVTAARELQEEAGYKAGRLIKLGEFFSAPGFDAARRQDRQTHCRRGLGPRRSRRRAAAGAHRPCRHGIRKG